MSKKKIWFTALLTLVLVFSVAGTAIAASGDNHPGGPGKGKRFPHGLGEVTSVGNDQFTAEKRNGTEIIFLVDDDTRYFGDLESFNDIEVGLKVAVMGSREGDQSITAKAVGAGEFPLGQRAGGEVTALDSDSLTIESRDGESLTFQVDGETLFFSRDDQVESLSDIEIGDHAMIQYEEASDGILVAKTIGSGTPDGDCQKGPDQRSGHGMGDGPKGSMNQNSGNGPQPGVGFQDARNG